MENLYSIGLRMLPTIPVSISAPAGTIINTFFACSRFWIMLYGIILIIHDIFFTIFPTTLLVITALTLVLHYTRIQSPPQHFVDAVFGYNPNISNPVFGSRRSSSVGASFMNDLAANIIGIPLQTALHTLNLDRGLVNLATQLLLNQKILSEKDRQERQLVNRHSHSRITHTNFTTPNISTPVSSNDMTRFNLTSGIMNPTNSPLVPIVAHQGAGYDAPENSLVAFVNCKERGSTFVHFDLKLSRDFVPLCFHDDDLYRMTGIAKKFNDFSANELRNIDISLKHHHGHHFRGARIPTLDEAVETCIRLNLKFFINVLDSNQQVVDIVCGTYKKYQAMYAMGVVTSFHFKTIHDIRRRDNKIIGCVQFPYTNRLEGRHFLDENSHSFFLLHYFHAWWEIFHDWIIENFFWWFLGLSAIIMEKDCMSKKQILEWGKKGIRVFLWPVNHPMEKLYLNQVMSVGYFTDTLEGDVVINPPFTKEQLANHKKDHLMHSIPPSPHPSDEALLHTLNFNAIKSTNRSNDDKIKKRERSARLKEKRSKISHPMTGRDNNKRARNVKCDE